MRLGLLVLRMKVLYIFYDTRTWIRRPGELGLGLGLGIGCGDPDRFSSELY